jgi:hypothetical protein
MERVTNSISEAFERAGSWHEGVVAGLAELLWTFDAEPLLAKVCLVESLAGGPIVLARREHELRALRPLIDAGREYASVRKASHALSAEATIASVAGILHTRFITGEAPPFIQLLWPLSRIVLATHLTERSKQMRAAERLAQTLVKRPPDRPQVALPVADPLPASLFKPQAFRARQCLLFLADHPGASNQQVAAGIGLAHHGQMSTLLARLQREALLVKQAGGAGRPNSWSLTAGGEQVSHALRGSGVRVEG